MRETTPQTPRLMRKEQGRCVEAEIPLQPMPRQHAMSSQLTDVNNGGESCLQTTQHPMMEQVAVSKKKAMKGG